MCGIIGVISKDKDNTFSKLFNGLKRLEYRGYDSYGFALITEDQMIVQTSVGQVGNAKINLKLQSNPHVGLSHTRWATHGAVTEKNAHPQVSCNKKIAVVHNGILTNYLELKDRLLTLGHEFRSETDTEVIPHLIEEYMSSKGLSFLEATIETVKDLGDEGSFAFAAINQDEPDEIVFAKNKSPLLVGVGNGENFIGSAEVAFLEHTRKFIPLEDMTVGRITCDTVELYTVDGKKINGKIFVSNYTIEEAAKGGFKHYMLKEIHEQGIAIQNTLKYIDDSIIRKFIDLITNAKEIFLVAAGTSSHSCMVGELLLEKLSRVRTRTVLPNVLESKHIFPGTLVIAVSQSGETADTISAINYAKRHGADIISIVNNVGTEIPRKSKYCLYTHAGPEIGVAATKTFTTQVLAFTRIAIELAFANKIITPQKYEELLAELHELPDIVTKTIQTTEYYAKKVGTFIRYKPSAYFLGSSTTLPVALEGALKLKEIAYVHAEGYNAAESKHGPIALIEKDFPVIFVVPSDHTKQHLLGNIKEMAARGAKIITILEGDENIERESDIVIRIPKLRNSEFVHIPAAVVLQMIAYYAAAGKIINGVEIDPDKPKNLAKSVTVS